MGINIRGGSKVIQYYASINHNRDEGMLKTDRLNQFDVNIKNNNTTFRVNLNIDLSKGIKLVVNSYSTIDSYHGPLKDVTEAYSLAFYANPVDFAPTYRQTILTTGLTSVLENLQVVQILMPRFRPDTRIGPVFLR